jgi:hypothetical protein
MEQYLKEQYNVFEDEKWLTNEDEIVGYFKDCGSDFLDCGQGYYDDNTSIICKISEKFYKVKIEAEIMSAKQDVGDRLYWVEDIKDVTYEEIEKPKPKDKISVTYNLSITEDQKRSLEHFMKEYYIEFFSESN